MRKILTISVVACLGALPLPSQAQAYSRTDTTTYYDDLGKWVLGQVKSSVNQNTGLTESNVEFDAASAKPQRLYAFGRLRQSLGYNGDGTLRTVVDGRNNTTVLSDWKGGLPQRIQFPDGAVQAAEVDGNGWIRSITDARGNTTRYDYDGVGRMTLTDYPDGDVVDWASTSLQFIQVGSDEYGIPAGHWRQTISTGNARKVTYYDSLWRPLLVREFDAADEGGTQRATAYGYDSGGRRAFASYPVAAVGSIANVTQGVYTDYDALGRVTEVLQDSELGPLSTRTQYLSGRRMQVTNPRNVGAVTTFMGYDQPSYEWPLRVEQAEGVVTEIGRDVFGKPKSITRRKSDGTIALTRSYVYDAAQRLCKTIEPETGASVVEYDAADNVVGSTQGLNLPNISDCNTAEAAASGRRVVKTYDVSNRVSTLAFPDGNGNQRWKYWPDGLVKQVSTTNAGVDTYNSFTYSRRGLPIGEAQSQTDGEALAMGYVYDVVGNLAAHRYPSGSTVAYAPNALGQARQAGSYATGASYYPNGAIRQFTYGNGIVHTMVQNARQLPDVSEDAYGGVRFLSDGYDYDANGNVAAITDGATGRGQRGNRTMGYDGLDRLTSTVSPMFGTASYSYDALDNLTHVVAPGRDHYYCYDGSWRLTNVKTGSCGGSTVIGIGYDVQGNLVNKNGQLYSFDYGNRLREATGRETYRYDGQGRRTQAIGPLGTIASMYDQAGVLRYQANQRDSTRTDYINLGGSLVAEVSSPLGSVAPAKDYVSWPAVGSAASYVVEESVDGVTWTSVYEGSAVNWTSSVRPTNVYTYRVMACTAPGACTQVSNITHEQRPQINIVPLLYQLLLG